MPPSNATYARAPRAARRSADRAAALAHGRRALRGIGAPSSVDAQVGAGDRQHGVRARPAARDRSLSPRASAASAWVANERVGEAVRRRVHGPRHGHAKSLVTPAAASWIVVSRPGLSTVSWQPDGSDADVARAAAGPPPGGPWAARMRLQRPRGTGTNRTRSPGANSDAGVRAGSNTSHRRAADELPAARRFARVDSGLPARDAHRPGRHAQARRRAPRRRDRFVDRAHVGKPGQEPEHVDAVRRARRAVR